MENKKSITFPSVLIDTSATVSVDFFINICLLCLVVPLTLFF